MALELWNSVRPALVDDELAELRRFRWRLDRRGSVIRYCEVRLQGRIVRKMKLAHAVCGLPPAGMYWRHVNGDRLDCRRSNLVLRPLAVPKQQQLELLNQRGVHRCR